MPNKEPLWARPLFAFPLIFLATFCFQLPFFDRWYSLLDEGHMLMFADIVARGGELYRDATIYPLPGSFYLLAYAFKAFGTSMIVSRWIVMLQFCCFVPLVFLFLRRIVSPGWAYGAVVVLWFYRVWVFPHWQFYGYSSTTLLFILCAMMCIVKYFETERESMLLAAGLLFGVAVACKQDYGAAMFLASLFTLMVWLRSKPAAIRPSAGRVLGLFLLPGACVGLALGLYFLIQGILPDLIQQTVLGHLKGLATFEYAETPSLFPLFSQDPGLRDSVNFYSYFPGIVDTVDVEYLRNSTLYRDTALFDFLLKLFYYGPYFVTIAGAIRAWLRRKALADTETRNAYLAELILLTFGIGIALVLSFNKPQDYAHFAVVYWVYLGLFLIYLHALLHTRKALAWGIALVMIMPVGYAGAYSVRLIERLRELNTDMIDVERAGIYTSPAEGRLLKEIVDYVATHTEPDDRVSVVPYFPIVQFLMDRLGPHRSSYIVWPFPEFDHRDERIIAGMEASDVEIVIYNFTQFINFPLMSEYSPTLFKYLVDHYRIERVFSFDYSGYKLAALRREPGNDSGNEILTSVSRAGDLKIVYDLGPSEPLPPRARDSYLSKDLWPFRPVMAIKPTREGGRSVYALELLVPQDAHLVGAVGVNPKDWFTFPTYNTTFRLELIRPDGVHEQLYARTLKPHSNFDDRGWFDFDLSLADYAGQEVVLEFATTAQLPEGESIWGGGWEVPRLVVRKTEAASLD